MHCWARYILIAVVASLGVLSMGGACGRKGPLYLPEQSPQKARPAQSEVPETPLTQPTPGAPPS